MGGNLPAVVTRKTGAALPAIAAAGGVAACFVWDEFFIGSIRNPHTRRPYVQSVVRFLGWCEGKGLELSRITPGLVNQYGVSPPNGRNCTLKALECALLKTSRGRPFRNLANPQDFWLVTWHEQTPWFSAMIARQGETQSWFSMPVQSRQYGLAYQFSPSEE